MNNTGSLTVIAGPMFCGKTEELIRLVKRAVIGKKSVLVFKPSIDIRYGKDKKVFSHTGIAFDSELVSCAEDIEKNIHSDVDIVAIDEAQWLGDKLIPVINRLVERGIHVIVAGLALTFDRQPFEPIPALMAMADKIIKLTAICSICGADAIYHKRITRKGGKNAHLADPSLVGKIDDYQARCRNCFDT